MINIIHEIVGSKLRRFLVTGLLVSLVGTGGLFAYAYTSDTTSIGVSSAASDFAEITGNVTVADYDVFGSYRGAIGPGTLFDITPDGDYNGDLEVVVYLDNIDDLSKYYGMLLLRIRLVDGSNQYMDKEGFAKPLTLNNGVVSFISDNMTPGDTYYIRTTGGVYRAFAWAYLSGVGTIYGPSLTAEVIQAGVSS